MKKTAKIIALILALVLVFCACGKKQEETPDDSSQNGGSSAAEPNKTEIYSSSLDENGRFKGVTALDHVELPELEGITMLSVEVDPSDEEIQERVQSVLELYTETEYDYEKTVADGDSVNIDYVGSIDGVEFAGGSTGGQGTVVTIGVTSYIDDFLQQLIGHKPGDHVKVEVTFPDDYGNPDLNGKDAVFETTINYVVKYIVPELTDSFAAENLVERYGVDTAEGLRDHFRKEIRTEKMDAVLVTYLTENSKVKDLPDIVYEFEKSAFIDYYQDYADRAGMDLDTFISTYSDYKDTDGLVEAFKEDLNKSASYVLILQAAAEKLGIIASEDDIKAYFESEGLSDYTEYQDYFGAPYVRMMVNQILTQDKIESMVVVR